MIIVVTLLCIISLHTSQCASYRYSNTSCLETYKLDTTNKDKITCTGEHVVNHCIPDYQRKELEVCVQWKWITPDYCPYYDTFSDVIKELSCTSYCLQNDDLQDICTCPSISNDDSCNQKCKNDFGSDKYIFCEPDKVSTTISTAANIISVGQDLRNSSDSQFNVSPTFSITSGRNGTKNSPESQFNGSYMGIAGGVIVPFILLVVVGVLLLKRSRHKQGTSQRETAVERGEGDVLMDTETRCLEENEQNQQQIEKDEGTSTEDKESLPPLAENKNENQSESQLKENQDTNFGSPQKNESFKTPPTTPAVQTEPDNNEDVPKDIKVIEGIFVDSLESITKEDDEGGGSSELQDLLEYVCTRPVKKILFNVVKMNVDNPDSYFQDESKQASIKTVLPTEYHSALDHESEHKHSIPVMHAILQVSLSEEHQPKSGWGQKVKDTDTGVGDDIERVYQGHTLSREIQKPEEISADGYVRLFEMLIGAIQRLDSKGRCQEDYKEIVRRWGNIQRKLWVKDKWTTFTHFIKKWSQTE